MVFTSNSNLIQSEAALTAEGTGDGSAGAVPGTGSDSDSGGGRGGALRVDHLQLPCEYHQAIVAGLSLAGRLLRV